VKTTELSGRDSVLRKRRSTALRRLVATVVWQCPICGSPVRVLELLTAAQIQPKNKGTRSISLIAPNQAVHLTKTMRASTCAQCVCLAVENYRFNRLGNDSTRHIRSAANRLCRIPLNQPNLLPRLRRFHQHSKPIT
jgi:hypothetical protein